jgi:alkanesulfonate monooxygenase
MRFALMTEPQQGLSYTEILALVRTAEDAGFESYFRSDHSARFPGEAGLPTTDAWATLAGLARETTTITLGTLVSPVTFRLPGPFAKLVATVDEMSGGRVEVGLGAGWHEAEHAAHGIPCPPLKERYDMLEESLAILHGLWTEPDAWAYDGDHWQVRDARFAPQPAGRDNRRHPNVIIGGEGKPRGLALAARYADEYNLVSARPERAREVYRLLDEECERIGRDPGEVARSAMTGVLVAESDADLQDRVRAQIAALGSADDAEKWLEERRSRWVMGTPEQTLERIADFEAAGVQRLMLQDFLPRDLDMIRVAGQRVVNA